MEYPCCVPGMCGGHQDYVTTRDGKVIGLSSSAVYSSHYHKMISECTIDMEYAKECEEVIVKWGDYGKRIKDIRAVIWLRIKIMILVLVRMALKNEGSFHE